MNNDSKTKNEQAAPDGNVSSLGTASNGGGESGHDFTLTIDFLTRRVRALIRRVGNRQPTASEQAEGKELLGRLASLKRDNEKHFA